MAQAPYGMQRVGKTLRLCDQEQQVMDIIRHGHEAGFGWQQIADRLNAKGFRTRRKARFSRQAVFGIWKRLRQDPF